MRGTRVAVAAVVALGLAGCSTGGDRGAPAGTTERTTATSTAVPTTTRATPTTSTTSTTTAAPTTATTTTPAGASGAVDRLVVRPGDDPGLAPYRRDAFGDGWDYDPSTGCNVRERVLLEESLVPANPDDRCRPTTGRWRSEYDGVVTSDRADLEIDHRVALADAWRSGAAAWPAERRHAYANDLTDPNTLAAVTTHANRSKGDSSPDEWMPPDRGDWCRYAQAWVEVKARWRLSVTAAEKATLVQVLQGC